MRFVKIIIIINIFLLLPAYSVLAQNASIPADSVNLTDAAGKRQGLWRENFGTGILKRETIYKDGLKNGLDLIFYQWPNCLKEESEYRNDTLVRKISYHRNCNIKMAETFRNGQREGYTKVYNSKGELETEGLYKNGKLQGTLKHYDKNGTVMRDNDLIIPNIRLEGYLTGDIPVLDSTVIRSLAKIPLTTNTVIVTDVTGSMHRSAGQLLLWYNMYMGKTPVSKFVFFNDGDGMPDLKKKIGKTGGIYPVQPDNITELKNVMELAITKGTGGDQPENNIEASLNALATYKNTDQIVLIVDRRSPVKDIELLKKVKVPVHIILCGPEEITHPHYLQIAYKTNGNIYSLSQEVTDISTIQEGQKLKIANLIFAFRDGQFRRVKN